MTIRDRNELRTEYLKLWRDFNIEVTNNKITSNFEVEYKRLFLKYNLSNLQFNVVIDKSVPMISIVGVREIDKLAIIGILNIVEI